MEHVHAGGAFEVYAEAHLYTIPVTFEHVRLRPGCLYAGGSYWGLFNFQYSTYNIQCSTGNGFLKLTTDT